MPKISTTELAKHASPKDAWIVVNNVIWDVTEFAPKHPGGSEIVNQYLGQDATAAYNEVHGPSLVSKHLSASKTKALSTNQLLQNNGSKNSPPTGSRRDRLRTRNHP